MVPGHWYVSGPPHSSGRQSNSQLFLHRYQRGSGARLQSVSAVWSCVRIVYLQTCCGVFAAAIPAVPMPHTTGASVPFRLMCGRTHTRRWASTDSAEQFD